MKTTNVTVKISGISVLTFIAEMDNDYDIYVVNMGVVKALMIVLHDLLSETENVALQARYTMYLIFNMNGFNSLQSEDFYYKHVLGWARCGKDTELELFATKAV